LTYDIYPSMIEMTFLNLPTVNLILADMPASEFVKTFDFDYCRCFYTKYYPYPGIIASEECLNSIFTKTICNEISYGNIRPSRIIKALKYGYTFNRKFWNYFPELLKLEYKASLCR